MTFATAFVLLLLVLQAPQQAPPAAAANGLKATIRLNIAKVDVPAERAGQPVREHGCADRAAPHAGRAGGDRLPDRR